MSRKFLAVALCAMLVVVFACKKKEEAGPQMQGQEAPMGGPGMPPGPGGIVMPKGDLQIVVPAMVKGKWSGVKIVVEDKATRKTEEFTVKLNSDLKIPNSDLKISVGEFIPDFRMDVGTITSGSNDPNNPAVAVKVFEGGKQIFPENNKWGWLYAKFPAIHPFEHPKIGLTLKEGMKKS